MARQMQREPDADAYRAHALVLHGVADPADDRCPEDMDRGAVVAEYLAIYECNDTYTEVRSVSARLPPECLVIFDAARVPVASLDGTTRAWLTAASSAHGNAIDFEGTSSGPAVGA